MKGNHIKKHTYFLRSKKEALLTLCKKATQARSKHKKIKARIMQAREGELIENKDGIIFDVKGLIHPTNKIIAFPRFIPTTKGNRTRKKLSYNKIYNLKERFEFLKKNFPKLIIYDSIFDETLCEVPIKNIIKHYHHRKNYPFGKRSRPQFRSLKRITVHCNGCDKIVNSWKV